MGVGTRERVDQTKSIILAEGNFEEHPFFRIGDRNAGTGVLRYESELKTKEGHVLKQSWTVMAAHGRGLPGRFDQDVYVALLQLIDEKGLPTDGWLSFSLYELVELMSRKHSGRDYMQVRESLQRLATTSVESKNAFYHRGRKEYISDTFSLLSQVKLSEYEDRDGGRTDRNRVLLSEYFVDSYKANYLKDIDTRLYWALSSPVAKRLYRLIDKKRNGRRFWEAELFSDEQPDAVPDAAKDGEAWLVHVRVGDSQGRTGPQEVLDHRRGGGIPRPVDGSTKTLPAVHGYPLQIPH